MMVEHLNRNVVERYPAYPSILGRFLRPTATFAFVEAPGYPEDLAVLVIVGPPECAKFAAPGTGEDGEREKSCNRLIVRLGGSQQRPNLVLSGCEDFFCDDLWGLSATSDISFDHVPALRLMKRRTDDGVHASNCRRPLPGCDEVPVQTIEVSRRDCSRCRCPSAGRTTDEAMDLYLRIVVGDRPIVSQCASHSDTRSASVISPLSRSRTSSFVAFTI